MNENIFIEVKSYMKSNFYSFNESWLKECVQYCAETHPKVIINFLKFLQIYNYMYPNKE